MPVRRHVSPLGGDAERGGRSTERAPSGRAQLINHGEPRLATPVAPHRAPHPLDPRDALEQQDMAQGEGHVEAGARGAEEDPARWVDELMPSRRRPDPEPTLSLSPAQLRIGDRFTDADGEWEVASNPQTYRGGKDVEGRVQR